MRVGPPNHVYVPAPEEIPTGLCECGCGERTEVALRTLRRLRWFAGHPKPFRLGHHLHGGKRRSGARRLLSVAEAAYIAGIIDGEGTVGFRGGRSVRVAVINTDEELIAFLLSIGGSVGVRAKIANRRQCFAWTIGSRGDVKWLLSQVEPYMIVKRQKALDALALIDDLIAVHG